MRLIFQHNLAKISILFGICFCANITFAATLNLSPGSGVYTIGNTFTVNLVINTAGSAINAADGTISFDPKQLSVVSVTRSNSIFSLWTSDPVFSNTAGTITFSGGSPSGYTGSAGTVLSVTFRTLAAGSPRVTISGGSVLAADGKGTNVLTSMKNGAYTISAATVNSAPETIVEFIPPANTPGSPKVTSETHSIEGWSNSKKAELKWSVPNDVIAVRTLLDKNPSSIPTKVYDSPISSLSIDNLDEGISFFHIQFKNEEGWGKVAHYRLATDSVAPAGLTIKQAENVNFANPAQTFFATTTDNAGSSISTFKVQKNNDAPISLPNTDSKNEFTLDNLKPGHYSLVVEAIDQAGNSSLATYTFTIEEFAAPVFTEVPVRVPLDVIPVLFGKTRPNAKVTVTVSSYSTENKVYTTVASDSGEFRFIPDGTFTAGVYTITAEAEDEYGAQSAVSNEVKLVVEQSGVLKIGNKLVTYLSIFIPLLALLLVTILFVVYSVYRFRRFKKFITKEADDVDRVSHEVIARITQVLNDEVENLKVNRKTKKLTASEEHLVSIIASQLTVADSKIKKEIDEVAELLN